MNERKDFDLEPINKLFTKATLVLQLLALKKENKLVIALSEIYDNPNKVADLILNFKNN